MRSFPFFSWNYWKKRKKNDIYFNQKIGPYKRFWRENQVEKNMTRIFTKTVIHCISCLLHMVYGCFLVFYCSIPDLHMKNSTTTSIIEHIERKKATTTKSSNKQQQIIATTAICSNLCEWMSEWVSVCMMEEVAGVLSQFHSIADPTHSKTYLTRIHTEYGCTNQYIIQCSYVLFPGRSDCAVNIEQSV